MGSTALDDGSWPVSSFLRTPPPTVPRALTYSSFGLPSLPPPLDGDPTTDDLECLDLTPTRSTAHTTVNPLFLLWKDTGWEGERTNTPGRENMGCRQPVETSVGNDDLLGRERDGERSIDEAQFPSQLTNDPSPVSPCTSLVPLKRSPAQDSSSDSDSDIEYIGAFRPSASLVQTPRRNRPRSNGSNGSSPRLRSILDRPGRRTPTPTPTPTPGVALTPYSQASHALHPAQNREMTTPRNGRSRGGGSNLLSAQVKSKIAKLVLGSNHSLLKREGSRYGTWEEVCRGVGATQPGDNDRVRHYAKWLQETIPAMIARGEI